ncbi:MAG TPA: Trm112 family protein [Rhodospirillales bacterium]|nr:Trm112 family protein [Rhodospirillales bacterium]
MSDSVKEPEIDPRLLELLVCPLTKGPLRYDRVRNELVSEQAGLAYPIRDGIPIMLVDEARRLGEDEAIPPELRAGKDDDDA